MNEENLELTRANILISFQTLSIKLLYKDYNMWIKKILSIVILFMGSFVVSSANPITDPDAPFDFDVSKLACEEGNAKECINLGLKYVEDTNEIDKDYKKAKWFIEKACQYKDRIGCMLLLNIDEEERRDLLSQSCTDGNNTACIDMQVLKDKKYYMVDGKCSKCGSTHIGNYLYGLVYPDKKMQAKIDKGEIRLGGCMIAEDSPKYHCLKCGVDLYKQNTKGDNRDSHTEKIDKSIK